MTTFGTLPIYTDKNVPAGTIRTRTGPTMGVINFAAIRTALEHDPDLVAYFDDLLAVAADHQQTIDTMRKEIGWLADSLEPRTQHDTIKRLLFIRDIGSED